ncbi:hypothetical protein BT63DRAFT_96932 [Microthyrium microscopicum]|uniref:Uncharacterized protein n=1 Tax=Microthyrium microscopicum TaxID=703497 RepID=A0A6A6U0F9_9PEZI|nr:hypothetical protein BT63DRAFT_96932 [Microthyrium microscopicum]
MSSAPSRGRLLSLIIVLSIFSSLTHCVHWHKIPDDMKSVVTKRYPTGGISLRNEYASSVILHSNLTSEYLDIVRGDAEYQRVMLSLTRALENATVGGQPYPYEPPYSIGNARLDRILSNIENFLGFSFTSERSKFNADCNPVHNMLSMVSQGSLQEADMKWGISIPRRTSGWYNWILTAALRRAGLQNVQFPALSATVASVYAEGFYDEAIIADNEDDPGRFILAINYDKTVLQLSLCQAATGIIEEVRWKTYFRNNNTWETDDLKETGFLGQEIGYIAGPLNRADQRYFDAMGHLDNQPAQQIVLTGEDSSSPDLRRSLESVFSDHVIQSLYQNMSSRDPRWSPHSGALGPALMVQRIYQEYDHVKKDKDEL